MLFKTYRGEQKKGKDETDECSSVQSRNAASGKESTKGVKNRAEERDREEERGEENSESDECECHNLWHKLRYFIIAHI